MYARFTAFAVWALLAGSIVLWLLKLTVNPLPAPAHTVAALDATPSRVDLSRLLGSTPVGEAISAPAAESRFHLVGVVAPKASVSSSEGVALISIDGKPARPFRVGAAVDADLLLLSVTSRSAALGVTGQTSNMVLQLVPPSTAVNAPIGNAGFANSAVVQQNTPPNMLAPGNRIAPVPITPGLNPAPEAAGGAQTDAPLEPPGTGNAPNGDLTR